MTALLELGRAMGSSQDVAAAVAAAHGTLRQLMAVDTTVFYALDHDSDAMTVACATGVHEAALAEMYIPRGQRLTGWVAANGRTVMNSDAALDLGNLIVTLQPTPLSCLSTPVTRKNEVIGALTLYSSAAEPFTASHEAIVEVVAGALAQVASRVPMPRRSAKSPAMPKPVALRLVGNQ